LTKTIAGLRKAWHRGLPKIDSQFSLAMPVYSLIRLLKLMGSIRPARLSITHMSACRDLHPEFDIGEARQPAP
jgi:hypothetical protein